METDYEPNVELTLRLSIGFCVDQTQFSLVQLSVHTLKWEQMFDTTIREYNHRLLDTH